MSRTALVVGATGLIGRALLRLLLEDPRYRQIHVLTRRPMPEAERQSVHVVDFDTMTQVPAVDDVYCCLGTTIKVAGSEAAFSKVDRDYVVTVAKLAHAAGASRFLLVSSLGADANSAVFYNRVKGEAEAAVSALGFAELTLARPSMLDGDRAATGQPPRKGEAVALWLLRPIQRMIPAVWRPIAAETVARALVYRAFHPGAPVVESGELQRLGARSNGSAG